ncbi:MAG: transglutaminaseTgpA domain-containing protein [Acidimicrobiales bacterium]
MFTFCAILGSGRYELASAAAFASTSLLFLGLQRATLLRREQSWSPDEPAATRTLVRGAAAIGAVAVLAGCLVGPTLPGAGSDAAVDWRGGARGDRSRVTVSPMVELRRRLVDQSDEQVFQVTSDVRSYWRLTSLDRFDGEIWSSDGEFRPADDELPDRVPDDLAAPTIHQSIEIDGLAAIWAPRPSSR